MTTTVHTRVDSPVGPLTAVARDGALAGLYMTQQRHLPDPATFGDYVETDALALFGQVSEQLGAYFAGDLTSFDVRTAVVGTPFQLRVWSALREIPYGETFSYGELAASLGRPGASRAVGLANGKNPISIIVPCHRVIGANGSLTGYGGGLERKRWLLGFEQSRVRPTLL